MFTELGFFALGLETTTPTAARGWAGSHLPSLPPEFFNRTPEGKSISATSPFCIRPDRDGGVKIDAFGEAATRRLLAISGALQADFLTHYPKGEVSTRSGVATLEETGDRLYTYEAHDFVIQSSKAHRNIFERWKAKSLPQEEMDRIAEELFRRKLEERCALLNLDLSELAVFGDFVATPVRPVYAGGMPKFAVCLSFKANVLFHGPWYLGRLANKSGGRVRHARSARRKS